MVEGEKEPIRGNVDLPNNRLPANRSSYVLMGCVSLMLLVVIAVAASDNQGGVSLEESSVQLFKSALESQQADMARHRKAENKIKKASATGDSGLGLTGSKKERLSDAKLFKDAVKEQHEELAKQRAAEAKAREIARRSAGLSSNGQKGSMSDASLLKDALKEQHAESKKVASARKQIKAAAKALNAKLEAQERLKSAEAVAKKKKESSDEKLFQDALKEQHDENTRETAALKKDLIIAAKKTKEAWENSKKARKAKISNELRAILGAQDTLRVKKAVAKAPPKSKLLKDALKEQHQDKVKEAAKEAAEKAAKPHVAVPKHLIATTKTGHQVLSTAAERTLVAFLTQADQSVRHKASPAQLALGQELQAARLHKANGRKAMAKGPAAGRRAGPAGAARPEH